MVSELTQEIATASFCDPWYGAATSGEPIDRGFDWGLHFSPYTNMFYATSDWDGRDRSNANATVAPHALFIFSEAHFHPDSCLSPILLDDIPASIARHFGYRPIGRWFCTRWRYTRRIC